MDSVHEPSDHPTQSPFTGTERYEIRRCLGAGSFGTVYEALDRTSGQRIALKVPHENRALSLLLFKHEFRALADVSHRNLVSLLELAVSGETWFYTMELVEGRDLFTTLREGAPSPRGRSGHYLIPALASGMLTPSSNLFGSTLNPFLAEGGVSPTFYSPPKDYDRIRRVFSQLIEGLCALHDAGVIHRDLKPSNVMVTPDERVVILDFGLALDGEDTEGGQGAVGTPAYLAPEQVERGGGSPASDWYAVGVMLYQVLTACLPHTGNYLEMLRAKQELDPCPPSLLVRGVPEDLEALCMDLLVRNPGERPLGHTLQKRLLSGENEHRPMAAPTSPLEAFGERRHELDVMLHAFLEARSGNTQVMLIHGESGMGKSALLKRFLKEARATSPRALLLRSRCFEQESVPFKALDGLVDGLCHFLRRLQAPELQAILPNHTPVLARLFPVLNHVPAIAQWKQPVPEMPDQHEFRRRAFMALREIFTRIAYRRPVVLVIEDLEWSDLDSTAALLELLRPPSAPPILLVTTFETQGAEEIPLVQRLKSPQPRTMGVTTLPLEPLPHEAARLAVLRALDASGPETERLADWAATESGGSPFLLAEIVQYLRADRPERPEASPFSVESHLAHKVYALDPGPRRLVELLCVAGHPVPWEALRHAAQVEALGDSLLQGLRIRRLLRLQGGRNRRQVEPYHPRVQRAVLATLSPDDLRRAHFDLAMALEEDPLVESAILAPHFAASGRISRAAYHAERAGDDAAAAFAFAQAVSFYRQAIDWSPPESDTAISLWPRLADALAHAGRGPEAAEAYLKSAQLCHSGDRERLLRRAAEEFFRSGHIAEGLELLRPALKRMGAPVPASQAGAVFGVITGRLRLALRGMSYQIRSEHEIPADKLAEVDTLWAVAMGLGPMDLLRSAHYQALQLRRALDAGEAFRLVRGLAHECIFQGVKGNRNLARTQALLDLTEREAKTIGHPNPEGRSLIAKGICATLQGRWRSATTFLEAAASLLREQCRGIDYEVHIAHYQALVARSILGDIPKVVAALPPLLQDAQERGDLMAACHYQVTCGHFPLLAVDEPAEARRLLDEAMVPWKPNSFQMVHYQELVSRMAIDFYEGRLDEAWTFLQRQWPGFRHSTLMSAQIILITGVELRLRARLAHLAARRRWSHWDLFLVRRDLRTLRAQRAPYSEALALKAQSGLAWLLGDRDGSLAFLQQAAEAFHGCEMHLHEASCRLVMAHLSDAPSAYHESEAAFASRGIQKAWAWALSHLPWLHPTCIPPA